MATSSVTVVGNAPRLRRFLAPSAMPPRDSPTPAAAHAPTSTGASKK